MNRDCSVLGIDSEAQTDTEQDFHFSAETETETEHRVVPRDETEQHLPKSRPDRFVLHNSWRHKLDRIVASHRHIAS